MAEIKSTLEIALERAARMSQSSAERRAAEPEESLEEQLKRLGTAAFRRGTELHDSGRLEAALTCYREALTYTPGDYRALNNMGSILTYTGKFEEAEKTFQQALAIKPDDSTVYHNLGKMYQDLDRGEEALACYKQVLANDPTYSTINSAIAEVYLFVLKDYDNAVQYYDRQLELHPRSAVDVNNLAIAHSHLVNTDKAIELCHEAIMIKPDYPAPHANLATYYYRKRDVVQGDRHLDILLRIDPNDPKTKATLMIRHQIESQDETQDESWLADSAERALLENAIDGAERNGRFRLYQDGQKRTFVYIDQSMVRDQYVFKKSDDFTALFRELLMILFNASAYRIRRTVDEMRYIEYLEKDQLRECFDDYERHLQNVDPREHLKKRMFVEAKALIPRRGAFYLVTSRKSEPNLKRLLDGLDPERKTRELEQALDSLAIFHSGFLDIKVNDTKYQ